MLHAMIRAKGCIVRNLRTYVCVAMATTSIVNFFNLQSRGLNLFPRRKVNPTY
jgi:hypothetical protein